MSWRADAPRRAPAAAEGGIAPARAPRPARGTSLAAMARTLVTLLGYLVGIVAVCYLVAFVAFMLAVAS